MKTKTLGYIINGNFWCLDCCSWLPRAALGKPVSEDQEICMKCGKPISKRAKQRFVA